MVWSRMGEFYKVKKMKLTFLNVGPLQKSVGTNRSKKGYEVRNRDQWERGGRKGGHKDVIPVLLED